MTQDLKTKAYERGIQAHLKSIAESGSDVHENYTPAEICDMMLDKVDLTKAETVLVLYNIELLFALKKRRFSGHVTFFTQSQEKAGLAPKIFSNITVEYIDKEENPLYHMENKWPDKFDIIVANPPYGNGGNWKLHLDFLDKSLDVCSGEIVFVHPANQFILPAEVDNKYIKNINEKISNSLSSISLFNGNPIFGISKHFPLSITHIIKEKKNKQILVQNLIMGNSKKVESIEEINLFNEYVFIPSIKSKVKSKIIISLEDKLKNKRASGERGERTGEYFIQIDSLVGSTDDTNKRKMWKESFFTFIGKNVNVRFDDNLPAYWFDFTTENECINFLNFLKTDFARFCLSLLKTDKHVNSKMWLVPYMDFTQEWTDEKLYAHFNITKEEQVFIKEVIPPYYD